jgi:dTDP-4-dehydrorhamnose reductase
VIDPNINKPGLLLTGGSGLLALNWACAMRNRWNVVLGVHEHTVRLAGTSVTRLNLQDVMELGRQLDVLVPDLVVHTAGLTSVDRCEENRALANEANAVIARNIAEAAAKRNIVFIHISTDHLFAGERCWYSEQEPVQPINEYGRSKALAEEWVQTEYPKSLILRTNFFGWGHRHRQSFSDWLIYNLRAGKPLTLFDDVYFTPILADRLALAAHELVEKGASGIFNLVGPTRLSKYEFGLRVSDYFSLPASLINRGQLSRATLLAPRPRDMSLDSSKAQQVLGHGLGTIHEYLRELQVQEEEGRRSELLESIDG